MLQNFERLDLTLLKRSISRHSSGLYVLPHPAAIHDVAAIDPEHLRRFFGLLRAAFNTVVIDTSKGLLASDFAAFELSDVILVVIQLDVICLRNTVALDRTFSRVRGLGRAGQARRQPVRFAGIGDQPEEGRRDAEDAGHMADTQRVATVSGSQKQRGPARGNRQGEPAAPGLSGDRPVVEPAARHCIIEAPSRIFRGVSLTIAAADRRGGRHAC